MEVGLLYFGERCYAPSLGRWASPDPLAVHGLGADLNVYAYVHGAVLRATDPVGLADMAADNPPPVSVDHPTETFSAAPALNAASVPEGAGPIGSPGNPLDLDAVRAPKATPTPAATASTGPFEGPNVQGPSVDLPSAGSYEYGAKYPRRSLDDDVPAYHNPIAQDEANRGNWKGAKILERGEPCNYCHSVVVKACRFRRQGHPLPVNRRTSRAPAQVRAEGRFALGVVARSNGEGGVFGYFFGPRRSTLEQVTSRDAWPSRAILVGKFGDLGLIELNTTAGKHPGSVVNRARDRVRTTGISAAIG